MTEGIAYTNTGVSGGITYRYRVRAYSSSSGFGPYSTFVNVTTLACSSVEIVRVGSDNTPVTAPSGTTAKLNTTAPSAANPYIVTNVPNGSYTAFATDVGGYTETVRPCLGTGCFPSGFTSPPLCMDGFCNNGGFGVSNNVYRIFFKYITP